MIIGRAVIQDLFTRAEAQRQMSMVSMILGIASAAAPVLGGALLRIGPWQTIFWFLSLWGAFVAILVALTLPKTMSPNPTYEPGPFASARHGADVDVSRAPGRRHVTTERWPGVAAKAENHGSGQCPRYGRMRSANCDAPATAILSANSSTVTGGFFFRAATRVNESITP